MSVELEGKSANGEIKELLQLLAKPHVKVSLAPSLRSLFILYSANVKELQAQILFVEDRYYLKPIKIQQQTLNFILDILIYIYTDAIYDYHAVHKTIRR